MNIPCDCPCVDIPAVVNDIWRRLAGTAITTGPTQDVKGKCLREIHMRWLSLLFAFGLSVSAAFGHSNIIPWDIDCDTCLTKENYENLLKLFESNQNTIGNLTCDPDHYNDRNGCCWIFNKKYLHFGKDIFGIDCVSYEIGEHETKTLMSQAVVEEYPATPASYDYINSELFPLQLVMLVGHYVFRPNKAIDLMKRFYGDETYLKYPDHEYRQWLQYNSNKLFLLTSPYKTLPEVQWLAEGFNLTMPFVIRNSTEFNVDIQEIKDSFIKEQRMIPSFKRTEGILNQDISNDSNNILQKWENDELGINITASPATATEFLPKLLFDRINKLTESCHPCGFDYVLTSKNMLTKLQIDASRGHWTYLKSGKKLWWFISPADIAELKSNNYLIESLHDLSFTELVFLHNYYLWGKIYVLLLGKNDFVYFPEHWAHRVFTIDKACGIGGYMP